MDRITAEQLGKRLGGKSASTIYRWHAAGIIPGLKIERTILFVEAEVQKALDKLQRKQAAEKTAKIGGGL
jgi:hypothetical protein